jgi:hypothetical protein
MLPAGSCCGQTMTNNTSTVTTNLPRRGAPPTCEPTVTCETYCYEVFPAPVQKETAAPTSVRGVAGLASTIGGELFARLACCVQTFLANMPATPQSTPADDPVGWSNFCCNLRQALIQYLASQGGTDCQAISKLRAVACPSLKQDSGIFERELEQAITEELLIALEVLIGCFCSAALPPCPPPGDPRVPLASVRVRASDCTVLSVCDWTPLRKHVVTTKTLGYWLGWLPYVPMIREFMQEVCCGLFGLRDQLDVGRTRFTASTAKAREATNANAAATVPGAAASTVTGAAAGKQEADPAAGQTEDQAFSQPISFATRSYYASNPMSEAVAANLAAGPQSVSVQDLGSALFTPISPGTSGPTDPAQTLAATPHAKVLAEIARPLISSFGPLISAALGGLGQSGSTTDNTNSQLAAMRTELASLRNTVTLQQNALDALKPQPPAPATPG